MWRSLNVFTQSRSAASQTLFEEETRDEKAVVVSAAPPPSFQVDVAAHANCVRSLQRRPSPPLSPRASPQLHLSAPSTPRHTSPHPYAHVDAINALMGQLLDCHSLTQKSMPSTTIASSPTVVTPASPATRDADPLTQYTDCLESVLGNGAQEESRDLALPDATDPSLQDYTQTFVAGSESGLSQGVNMPPPCTRAEHRLIHHEQAQRQGILATESHCWRTLSTTIAYVKRTVVNCENTRLMRSWSTPSFPESRDAKPALHTWLRMHSCQSSSASAPVEHPYAAASSPPPLPRPRRLFLRPLPLNTDLATKSSPSPAAPQAHAHSPSPARPPHLSRQKPLVSPRRTAASDLSRVLLSPPAPPQRTSPSDGVGASHTHTENTAPVTWVPVRRDASGQLRVAWGAWNTAASASASTSPCASSLLCAWPASPTTLDQDEKDPMMDLSALSALEEADDAEHLDTVTSRFITVLGRQRWPLSPPAPPRAEPRSDDNLVLRVEESEISALDITGEGEDDEACDDGSSSPFSFKHRTYSPSVRYYHGTVIHSL